MKCECQWNVNVREMWMLMSVRCLWKKSENCFEIKCECQWNVREMKCKCQWNEMWMHVKCERQLNISDMKCECQWNESERQWNVTESENCVREIRMSMKCHGNESLNWSRWNEM